MKVALVHDYLNEFGGAERVLLALSEIWPKAPIYCAFFQEGSPAHERFKNREIKASWAHHLPFFNTKLHSPLRFLAPLIWNSFDFSGYDLVITSASWYITKGVRKGEQTVEICYCHTPPRYLYGYTTSVEWQKYWPVRVYALLVNHFMRIYDFEAAQKVNCFIANSQNVRERIKKFYRRDSAVIYPPVDLPKVHLVGSSKKGDYFLVVSRIVGGKGLQLAVEAAGRLGVNLKVIGRPVGYATEFKKLQLMAGPHVEFLGFVSDEKLAKLYTGAKALLATATDEDFGMTLAEAMLCGTPVIAFHGGGYLETIIDQKTGMFFNLATIDALVKAIGQFVKLEAKGTFDPVFIRKHAQKFSKERFKREIVKFVESKIKS